jgi:hypothetical protein
MNCSIFLTLIAISGLLFSPAPGQVAADIVEFRLTGNAGDGLLPGNVTPPSGSGGSGGLRMGGITFDTGTNLLHIDIGWGTGNGFGDLSGDVTMLHLHGPTDDPAPDSFSQTGPLLINLATSLSFNPSATSGGLSDNFFLGNPDVPALMQGRMYINVHTAQFAMGEIRGYLVAVPEPAIMTVILPGFILACGFRRPRQRNES